MEILKYKGFEGSTEVDTERGVCFGRLLFINDLVTYEADGPRDLKNQFESAVEDYLQTCQQLGREAQRPFHGLFNVRIPPDLHREASLRAVADGSKLNDVVVRALECYLHGKTEITNHITMAPSRSDFVGRASTSSAPQWSKVPTPPVRSAGEN